MNINDTLNKDVIAQSINRFMPMRFKTLKRVIEHYGAKEIYGIAIAADREVNGDRVIYDILFRRNEDSKVFTMYKDYFTILGVPAACVVVPIGSRINRVKPADIMVYGKDVGDMANDFRLRVQMLESDTTQRFIPLYAPQQAIPIPLTIF